MTNVSGNKFSEVEIVESSNDSGINKLLSDKTDFKESCQFSTLKTNGMHKKNDMKHALVHFVNFYQF